jgi:hypothetical protein
MAGFEGRLRDRYGDSVWIDRSSIVGSGLPKDHRPLAVWARQRDGAPYEVLPLVGPNAEWREPGDWVIGALQQLDHKNIPQHSGGALGFITDVWADEERKRQAAHDERMAQAREEATDMAMFATGNSQNWAMDPERAKQPANLQSTYAESISKPR